MPRLDTERQFTGPYMGVPAGMGIERIPPSIGTSRVGNRRRKDRGRENPGAEEYNRRIKQLLARAGIKMMPLKDSDLTDPETIENA